MKAAGWPCSCMSIVGNCICVALLRWSVWISGRIWSVWSASRWFGVVCDCVRTCMGMQPPTRVHAAVRLLRLGALLWCTYQPAVPVDMLHASPTAGSLGPRAPWLSLLLSGFACRSEWYTAVVALKQSATTDVQQLAHWWCNLCSVVQSLATGWKLWIVCLWSWGWGHGVRGWGGDWLLLLA